MDNRSLVKTTYMPSILVSICTLLLISITVATADGPPPAPVVVAKAKQEVIAPTRWVFGSVFSRNQANIAAEVTGRLLNVAEVGEAVKKGDVLAQIDASVTRLQFEELNAQIKSEKARLTFLDSEVERLQRLAATNHAAKTQLEQTQSDRDATQGSLAAARSRLAQAQDRVQRSEIKAPFSGTVAQRLMEVGEWASSGDAIVELIDISNLEIRARIPLPSMAFINSESVLRATSANSEVQASYRSLVPVGDTASRLADLRLSFSNTNWRPGQSVRVAVPVGEARPVLVVPRDALVLRSDATRVYRVNAEGVAEAVEVVLGDAEGDWIEVSGEIEIGDQIITRGAERLRPGQTVRIIDQS